MQTIRKILCCLLIGVPIGEAAAADHPVEGTKLVLARSKSGKEKLVFSSSERSLSLPTAGSADDPTSTGVTVELHSGLEGVTATLTIPTAADAGSAVWKDTGPNYRFVNAQAPQGVSGAKILLLQEGRRIKLLAKEVPLPLSGENGFISIRITMGDTRYCARFDAEHIRKDRAGYFVARRASGDSLADCSNASLGMAAPQVPSNTEPCPTIVNGNVTFLGNSVRIHVGDDPTQQDGPLVFVWHGLGSNPSQAVNHLLGPDNQLQEILDRGGMVAAPYGHGGLTEFTQNDFNTTDEIVACATEQVGIDPRQIHSVGFSAGGLITTMMSTARSDYVASIVGFAGGFSTTVQNPDNRVPAFLAHGGPTDFVFIPFDTLMQAFYDQIVDAGHFAILCDHGQGHTVPYALRQRSLPFFLDHPFGTEPSPYAGGLPNEFPSYCIASD